MPHRYKVGDILEMRPAPHLSTRPPGRCEVMFCLPHDSGPLLYRVKGLAEKTERVVAEIDLDPTDATRTQSVAETDPFSIAISKR